jgi:SAM-dependent methyltransferase
LRPPSPLFEAESERLLEASRLGPVADLACGRGRYALAAAERGAVAIGFDRDAAALAELQRTARARGLRAHAVRTDLEAGRGIPVRPASCGAILVFRFLFRPLATALREALSPGGLLLYETFTIHQRTFGYGPRNEDFLLRPGELLETFRDLEVLSYWEGITEGDHPEALARLVARSHG